MCLQIILYRNRLSGPLPPFVNNRSVGELQTLRCPALSPARSASPSNYSQVLTLSLGNNAFTGKIPHQYGSLNDLVFLFLQVRGLSFARGSYHRIITMIASSSAQFARRNYPSLPIELCEVITTFSVLSLVPHAVHSLTHSLTHSPLPAWRH